MLKIQMLIWTVLGLTLMYDKQITNGLVCLGTASIIHSFLHLEYLKSVAFSQMVSRMKEDQDPS